MKPMLCFRCEHRALYHEEGHHPRFECSCVTNSVFACYMFQPICPVSMKNIEGDNRDALAPIMIRSRQEAVGIADFELVVKQEKNTNIQYWRPKQ